MSGTGTPRPSLTRPDSRRMAPCDRLLAEDIRHLARHVENLAGYRELRQCAVVDAILQRWPLLDEVERGDGAAETPPLATGDKRCVS